MKIVLVVNNEGQWTALVGEGGGEADEEYEDDDDVTEVPELLSMTKKQAKDIVEVVCRLIQEHGGDFFLFVFEQKSVKSYTRDSKTTLIWTGFHVDQNKFTLNVVYRRGQ